MLTETKSEVSCPFDDLEVELYPDEFIRELNREADEAEEQIKSGELKPISLEDFARQLGVNFKR